MLNTSTFFVIIYVHHLKKTIHRLFLIGINTGTQIISIGQ